MENTQVLSEVLQVKLTKGTYAAAEARDLISALMKAETDFHKLQNLSSQIHYDLNCDQAKNNLAHLASVSEKIQQAMQKAKAENRTLKVESVIRITFED